MWASMNAFLHDMLVGMSTTSVWELWFQVLEQLAFSVLFIAAILEDAYNFILKRWDMAAPNI